MALLDPLKVRPRDGWLVVLAEPRKTKSESGLLYSPNESGAEKVCEGAGRVMRAGVGKKNAQLGLENGVRILYRGFLKHANPIETEDKWPDGQKKMYFVMSAEDVIGLLPEGVEVGIYSGRPQIPEKS